MLPIIDVSIFDGILFTPRKSLACWIPPVVRRSVISFPLLGPRFEHLSLAVSPTYDPFQRFNSAVPSPICDVGTALRDSPLIIQCAEAKPGMRRSRVPSGLMRRQIGLALDAGAIKHLHPLGAQPAPRAVGAPALGGSRDSAAAGRTQPKICFWRVWAWPLRRISRSRCWPRFDPQRVFRRCGSFLPARSDYWNLAPRRMAPMPRWSGDTRRRHRQRLDSLFPCH
jgi:hypothetical protein